MKKILRNKNDFPQSECQSRQKKISLKKRGTISMVQPRIFNYKLRSVAEKDKGQICSKALDKSYFRKDCVEEKCIKLRNGTKPCVQLGKRVKVIVKKSEKSDQKCLTYGHSDIILTSVLKKKNTQSKIAKKVHFKIPLVKYRIIQPLKDVHTRKVLIKLS